MAVVCLVISSLHALFNDCTATHDHQASHKAAYSVLFEKAEAGPRWVCTFPLASVNLMQQHNWNCKVSRHMYKHQSFKQLVSQTQDA